MQDAIILYENGKAIGGEGHPTDASDITFDNSNTDLVSENVEGAIKEVNARTKHGLVELWVNPNPSSNFAGQTVTVDITNLDAVIIVAVPVAGGSRVAKYFEFDTFDGTSKEIDGVHTNGNGQLVTYYRQVSISSSGAISFQDGKGATINSYGVAQSYATNNSYLVPLKILGLIHND